MQTAQLEGAQEAVPGPAPVTQPGPNINWVGPPMYIQDDTPHYKAASVAGQQISIG
jgi:hypothetical protein